MIKWDLKQKKERFRTCRVMQQMIPNRIVIYAKDIMNITGRRERAARKLLAKIRKKYKKKPGEFISVDEFCEFTSLNRESVNTFLSNWFIETALSYGKTIMGYGKTVISAAFYGKTILHLNLLMVSYSILIFDFAYFISDLSGLSWYYGYEMLFFLTKSK